MACSGPVTVPADDKEEFGGGDGGVSDPAVEQLAVLTDEARVTDENDHAVF